METIQKGATITVLKTRDGKRLGGYANVPWTQEEGHKPSTAAFLFRLGGGGPDKWERAVARITPEESGEALYHTSDYGPYWEEGLLILGPGNGTFAEQGEKYFPFPNDENVAGGPYGEEPDLETYKSKFHGPTFLQNPSANICV